MGRRPPVPDDYGKVPYEEARARFMRDYKSLPSGDEVKWLVAVGRYVQEHWLTEEQALAPGEKFLDREDGLKPLWDNCREKDFRELRAEGEAMLEVYAKGRSTELLAARPRGDLFRKLALPPGVALAIALLIRVVVEGVCLLGILVVVVLISSAMTGLEQLGPKWVEGAAGVTERVAGVADLIAFACLVVYEVATFGRRLLDEWRTPHG